MTQPPSDPYQDLALAVYYHVAELLKSGRSHEQIITELGLQGVKRETVETMIQRLGVSQLAYDRRRATSNLLVGLALTLLALGLIFGWFGLPYVTGVALFPALVALGVGGYWLVKGALGFLR